MPDTILLHAEERMTHSVESLQRELSHIRTGRANPAILDGLMVEYYGAETPLKTLASIQVPEPQLLQIKPFDKTSIDAMVHAINASDLGLNPNSDGEVIRLNIPKLTEERRKELSKKVKKIAEHSKIAIRNIRRDANDHLKKLEKSGDITEDDLKAYIDDVQEMTNQFIDKIDKVEKEKEQDIMTI